MAALPASARTFGFAYTKCAGISKFISISVPRHADAMSAFDRTA